MNEAAVASLEAHASRLRGEVKTLSKEKESLIREHAEEQEKHRAAIAILQEHKKTLESNIATLDQELFLKELHHASMKKEMDSFQADIEAASKYLDYMNSIGREHTSNVLFLEGKIEKLKENETMFMTYAKRLDDAKIQFESLTGSITSMSNILTEHNRVMEQERAVLALERKAIEDDKVKNLSYYNEVVELEKRAKERIENVQRQENMQRSRSVIMAVKKLDGGK